MEKLARLPVAFITGILIWRLSRPSFGHDVAQGYDDQDSSSSARSLSYLGTLSKANTEELQVLVGSRRAWIPKGSTSLLKLVGLTNYR